MPRVQALLSALAHLYHRQHANGNPMKVQRMMLYQTIAKTALDESAYPPITAVAPRVIRIRHSVIHKYLPQL